MRRSTLPLVALALAIPAVALASGGGGHNEGAPVGDLVRHLINLVLLLVLLVWGLRTPVSDFLKMRRAEIKRQLDASGEAKAKAEARYSAIETRLKDFEAELAEMMSAVERDGETERARLIAQAERSAEQMEQAAKRTIEEETRRAASELRAETIAIATELAEQLLASQVANTDHQRLAKEYLARVKEAAAS